MPPFGCARDPCDRGGSRHAANVLDRERDAHHRGEVLDELAQENVAAASRRGMGHERDGGKGITRLRKYPRGGERHGGGRDRE